MQQTGLSEGGRWVVLLVVKNGGQPATPDCTVTAVDADGVPLASDAVTLDQLGSGEQSRTRVLTGLKPGDDKVDRWTAECN